MKYKVAVLEDEKTFLVELVSSLRRIDYIDVVAHDQTSEGFISKVREKRPDILLLDIHLKDESTTGLNVAELFELPVIFLSSERKNYLDSIDLIKLFGNFPVDQIGKTFKVEILKSMFEKFLPLVREFHKSQKIKIKPIGEEEILISPKDVTFILSQDGNQTFYFIQQKPIRVADKSIKHFVNNGFDEQRFYTFNRGFLLNIAETEYKDNKLIAKYMNENMAVKTETLEVPLDKRKEVRTIFQK
jgi:two-component system LytT family response regulator